MSKMGELYAEEQIRKMEKLEWKYYQEQYKELEKKYQDELEKNSKEEEVILSFILKSTLSKGGLLQVMENIIKDNNFFEKDIVINEFGDNIYDVEIIGYKELNTPFVETFYGYLELEDGIDIFYKFLNIEVLDKYIDIYKKIHELELKLRKIFSISILSVDYDFLEILEKIKFSDEQKGRIKREFNKGKNIFNNFTFSDYSYFIEIFSLIDVREIDKYIENQDNINLIVKFITFLENIQDDIGSFSKVRNIVSHNKEYKKYINFHTEEKTKSKKDVDKEIIDGFLPIYEDLNKKIEKFYNDN